MSEQSQKDLDDQMEATYSHIVEWVKRIEDGTYDDGSYDDGDIYDYPLEIVNEVGKDYAVVLCTGGPQIEVTAYGLNNARLEGYWWGTRSTRHDRTVEGNPLTTFLDFFIERNDN